MTESLFETIAQATKPAVNPMTHIKISIDESGKGMISYSGKASFAQFLTVDQSARIMEVIYNEVKNG